MDTYTKSLFETLTDPLPNQPEPPEKIRTQAGTLLALAQEQQLTAPIVELFSYLVEQKSSHGYSHEALGIDLQTLEQLAQKHEKIDEHLVSIGGRVTQALPIASEANDRVDQYLLEKRQQAPSGIELWDTIYENQQRIKKKLSMSENDWHSFQGQIRHAVDSVETLSELIDLPQRALESISRVTKGFRMRLTPYYTSLILPGNINDPILLQSVPTGEMIDNSGVEIPPVAADHSPARLIDQFYPRVVTIKATNMCAMYCTHCLRIAHIGRKDHTYSKEAYREALDYIKANERIRDILITGGDAFVLPNSLINWLLEELDQIDHVRIKRLGTRIPVTAPMRIDNELLDIIEKSNDRKPIRVVTQINTAQEITPVSKDAFRSISKHCFTVLNQAVLLKGINDTKTKMWKLCETIQEAYVRPYYIFNCSYRNPQFNHFRVPIEIGRDIVESMYGNISGDAIPRYITTAGGKIPMHRSNVVTRESGSYILRKPWNGEEVSYPDADLELYENDRFSFSQYED